MLARNTAEIMLENTKSHDRYNKDMNSCTVCGHNQADCSSNLVTGTNGEVEQRYSGTAICNCGHDDNECSWDELVERAKRVIKETGRGYLQMPLKVPYKTQVRIVDQLIEAGLIARKADNFGYEVYY